MKQIIHNHPQKTSYANPSEWPTISAQSHWAPGENPIQPEMINPVIDLVAGKFGNSTIAHTHLDLNCPIYAEIGEPILCNFAIKLFHTAGHINFVPEWQEHIHTIIFDATGSTQVPQMIGDPNGLKVWTGHLTLNPNMGGDHPAPSKGWFTAVFSVVTTFDNGDITTTRFHLPLFSMRDPQAEETPSVPMLSSRFTAHSSQHPTIDWGLATVSSQSMIPLNPINILWPLNAPFVGYAYAPTNLNDIGTLQERLDLDLHSGVPGNLINSFSGLDASLPLVIDPTNLINGPHKVALIFNQPEGNNLGSALLVFDVIVDTNAPQICTDPVATNFGGPLPCIYPPPTLVVVPNVVGKNIVVATAEITAIGLLVNSSVEINTITKDQALSQIPSSGSIVELGSIVDLKISSGPTIPPPEFSMPPGAYTICKTDVNPPVCFSLIKQ